MIVTLPPTLRSSCRAREDQARTQQHSPTAQRFPRPRIRAGVNDDEHQRIPGRHGSLDIDPTRLPAYEAAVSEEIDDSIRLEPGVLTLYAVALAHNRGQLRFFEIYADDAAYRGHLDSPHFKKYVETTRPMIRSRKLFETRPVFLGLRQH